jgi:sterol desaturase/sphingolipid hydroxylase (fatty acid hydroxylase superfamily)
MHTEVYLPASMRIREARRRLGLFLSATLGREVEARSGDSPALNILSYAFMPIVVFGSFGCWLLLSSPGSVAFFIVTSVALAIVMVAERLYPMHKQWNQSLKDTLIELFVFKTLSKYLWVPIVLSLYESFAEPHLVAVRAHVGLEGLWPTHWPLIARVLLGCLAGELIWYWIHRAQHRWKPLWFGTTHVTHHSRTKLSALTSAVNHPIEYVFLFFPYVFLETVIGAGSQEMTGAALLSLLQGYVVHANLDLNLGLLGWIFTAPKNHHRHHSVVFDEQNSNYGCAIILWDRIFGTYVDTSGADRMGIEGGREFSLLQTFLIPLGIPKNKHLPAVGQDVSTQNWSPESGSGSR